MTAESGRKLAKATWTAIVITPIGTAFIFWFGWAIQATTLFTGTHPPKRSASPWLLASVITAVWLLAWTPIALSGLRDRQHRWLFTRGQVARAEAQDAARHQKETEQRIRTATTRLHENQHGDAGIIALMLDLPVETVLRVTGQQEQEQEEELPVPEFDPGPECDDQGGMSEHPWLTEPGKPPGEF